MVLPPSTSVLQDGSPIPEYDQVSQVNSSDNDATANQFGNSTSKLGFLKSTIPISQGSRQYYRMDSQSRTS